MKKITLDGDLYKKIYELSDQLLKDFEKGNIEEQYFDSLREYMSLLDHLRSNFEESNFDDWELVGRFVHYAFFDLPLWREKYLTDNSKETSILRNSFLALLELIEHKENSVVLQNQKTWEYYEIVGEGEWSQTSLFDLQVGILIFSRVIQIDWEYYVMKNYQYLWDPNADLMAWYKTALKHVDNLYDMHKVMKIIMEWPGQKDTRSTNPDNIVNNIRKIKKMFTNKMWKKFKFGKVKKLIQSNDPEAKKKFIKLCYDCWFNDQEVEELVSLAFEVNKDISYQNSTEEEKEQQSYLQLIFFEFQNFLSQNKPEFSLEKDGEEVYNQHFQEFLDTKIASFNNKTPREFAKEKLPWIDLSNVKMKATSPQEIDFYGLYDKRFTDEDMKSWNQALDLFYEWNFKKALENIEKLREKYPDFFRLEANYVSLKINVIMQEMREFIDSWEEISWLWAEKYIEGLLWWRDHIEYIKSLNPEYDFLPTLERDFAKSKVAFNMLLETYLKDEKLPLEKKINMFKKVDPKFDYDTFIENCIKNFSCIPEYIEFNDIFEDALFVRAWYASIWQHYVIQNSLDTLIFEDYLEFLLSIFSEEADPEELEEILDGILENKDLITDKMKIYCKSFIELFKMDENELYRMCNNKRTKDKLWKFFELVKD